MADPPDAIASFVDLDHDRAARRGYPGGDLLRRQDPRAGGGDRRRRCGTAPRSPCSPGPARSTRAAVLSELPDAFHDTDAGLLAWPPTPPEPTGGLVVVLAAGTSDLPVAREAELTARYLGRPTELVVDVGVAGLHRVLRRLDLLRAGPGGRGRRRHGRGAAQRGGRPGQRAGGRRAHLGRLRRRVRGTRRPAGHAQRLRAGRRRGQHRQRLRRRPPGRADRRAR